MTSIFLLKNNLNITRIVCLSLTVVFLFSIQCHAQSSREETVQRLLNTGKQLIDEGKYDSATITLKSAFIKNATLPDELLFYYGVALYKSGEIDQSKKLIDKFLSLSSTSKSDLFDEATEFKKTIGAAIESSLVVCTHCNGSGHHEHTCSTCNGRGEQKCDICKGKGRVLVGVSNGMKYGLCTTCMGDGLRSCLKCNGKKQIRETCPVCNGKGKVRAITK